MIGGFSRGGGCFGGVFPSGLFAGEDKMRAPPFPLRFVLFVGSVHFWVVGFRCGFLVWVSVSDCFGIPCWVSVCWPFRAISLLNATPPQGFLRIKVNELMSALLFHSSYNESSAIFPFLSPVVKLPEDYPLRQTEIIKIKSRES